MLLFILCALLASSAPTVFSYAQSPIISYQQDPLAHVSQRVSVLIERLHKLFNELPIDKLFESISSTHDDIFHLVIVCIIFSITAVAVLIFGFFLYLMMHRTLNESRENLRVQEPVNKHVSVPMSEQVRQNDQREESTGKRASFFSHCSLLPRAKMTLKSITRPCPIGPGSSPPRNRCDFKSIPFKTLSWFLLFCFVHDDRSCLL